MLANVVQQFSLTAFQLFLRASFKNLKFSLATASYWPYIFLTEGPIWLSDCGHDVSAREKILQEILSEPTHSLHNMTSNYFSHISPFCPTSCRSNICRSCIDPYLERTLAAREPFSVTFQSSLFQKLKAFLDRFLFPSFLQGKDYKYCFIFADAFEWNTKSLQDNNPLLLEVHTFGSRYSNRLSVPEYICNDIANSKSLICRNFDTFGSKLILFKSHAKHTLVYRCVIRPNVQRSNKLEIRNARKTANKIWLAPITLLTAQSTANLQNEGFLDLPVVSNLSSTHDIIVGCTGDFSPNDSQQ